MSRYKMSRKTARARKSMKMGADDLQEMVKAAVKEALDEQKAEDGSEDDPEESGGDLGEILDAAIEAVNAKRKSAKSDELNPDDTEELVGAILEEAGAAEDGKSDDEATDLEEVIKAACEAVNEKRKSAKADEMKSWMQWQRLCQMTRQMRKGKEEKRPISDSARLSHMEAEENRRRLCRESIVTFF